jgi:DNA-binding Lrp family transcriptional regulator
MDPLLELLSKNGRETDETLARLLNIPVAEVEERRITLERSGAIRGYRAVINEAALGTDCVRAAIELRIRVPILDVWRF